MFKLSRAADGRWTATILHNFNNNGMDGYPPNSGLILEASGNFSLQQGGWHLWWGHSVPDYPLAIEISLQESGCGWVPQAEPVKVVVSYAAADLRIAFM